ncbi:MAG: DUF3164 family protein [Alphaproteobacteria bacterium]|nr:DUF3164 family protein [Alphaproteobacteria bacterium]
MDKLEAIKGLSADERKELLEQLKQQEREDKLNRREAYEGLRAQFMIDVKNKLTPMVDDVKSFREWLEKESAVFNALMRDYGQLRKNDQESFTVIDGNFKLEIKSNKVKSFDERADMAAERLVDYLKRYVQKTEKGVDDPMYQLAMTLLERNKMGDLDYKSISKLYELEDRFDEEYGEIMSLFKESNVVQKTAVNYYFNQRDVNGVWRRIEPSFCRL